MDSHVKRKKGQGCVVVASIEVRTDPPIKAKRGGGGIAVAGVGNSPRKKIY